MDCADVKALKALEGSTGIQAGWQRRSVSRCMPRSPIRDRRPKPIRKNNAAYHQMFQAYLDTGEESLADLDPNSVSSHFLRSAVFGMAFPRVQQDSGMTLTSGDALRSPKQPITINEHPANAYLEAPDPAKTFPAFREGRLHSARAAGERQRSVRCPRQAALRQSSASQGWQPSKAARGSLHLPHF
eukprot:jgi/Tetstr1/422336/TSEL_013179.t1